MFAPVSGFIYNKMHQDNEGSPVPEQTEKATGRNDGECGMAKVTILMSLYRPEKRYLREQLRSLNEQTYSDLELLIRNDCPETPADREMIAQEITRFPFTLAEGEKNLGYSGAFGELSRIARGDYLSYCDQDDIWDKDKIRLCMEAIEATGAVAVVCDRALADADGNVTCENVRNVRKERAFTWHTGDDITSRAAFTSYCTGMTLVAEREAVQKCLPFVPVLPHDQQLAFLLSGAGKIAAVEQPLVKHRRYGTNASGTLAGVGKKQDYYDTRCKPVAALLEKYEALYPDDRRIVAMKACCEARIRGDVVKLWQYREMIPDLYRYEIALALCPGFLFGPVRKALAGKK